MDGAAKLGRVVDEATVRDVERATGAVDRGPFVPAAAVAQHHAIERDRAVAVHDHRIAVARAFQRQVRDSYRNARPYAENRIAVNRQDVAPRPKECKALDRRPEVADINLTAETAQIDGVSIRRALGDVGKTARAAGIIIQHRQHSHQQPPLQRLDDPTTVPTTFPGHSALPEGYELRFA